MIVLALATFLQVDASMPPSDPASSLTQAKLDVMSDACHVPRGWLRQIEGDQVRFRPSPTAKYNKIDCVLKQLRSSIYPLKVGYIGNEALNMDDGQK